MTLPPEPIQSHLRQLEHEQPDQRMQALRQIGDAVREEPEHEVHLAPALIRRISKESDPKVHEQLIKTILTSVQRLRKSQHPAFALYEKAIGHLKTAFSKLSGQPLRFERQSAIARTLGQMATHEAIKALFELGTKPDDFKYGLEPLAYGIENAGQVISRMESPEKQIDRKDARYPLVIARTLSTPNIYLVYKACQDRKQTEASIAALVQDLTRKERGY